MDKKSKTIILILILIVLVLIGVIIYMNFYKNNEITTNDTSDNSETIEQEPIEQIDDSVEESTYLLKFDSSKSLNTKDMEYSLKASTNETSIWYNNETKNYEIVIDWNDVKYNYGFDNPTGKSQTTITLNFDKEVEDIFSGQFFQSEGGVYLFLMEDGTVEYLPLFKALKTNDIKSYGKIDNVEDVVKFYEVSANQKGDVTGGYQTVLAQKSDGTFYDLSVFMNTLK